ALQVADPSGVTPLLHAVQQRLASVVAALLAAGAHPSLPHLTPSLNSALHVAALKGDLPSVRHLLSYIISNPASPTSSAPAPSLTPQPAAASTPATETFDSAVVPAQGASASAAFSNVSP
ncbi:hypothetical protein Agub_g2410, partial [Astrephomene gubernaculifera]